MMKNSNFQWESKDGTIKKVPDMTEKEAKEALCECLSVICELENNSRGALVLLKKHNMIP